MKAGWLSGQYKGRCGMQEQLDSHPVADLHARDPIFRIAWDVRKNILSTSSKKQLLTYPTLPTSSYLKNTVFIPLNTLDFNILNYNAAIALELGQRGSTKLGRIAVIPRRNGMYILSPSVTILARVKQNYLVVLPHDGSGGAKSCWAATNNADVVLGSYSYLLEK